MLQKGLKSAILEILALGLTWLVTCKLGYLHRFKLLLKVKYKIVLQVNLDMTDHCMTDFCIWRTMCLVPVRCISYVFVICIWQILHINDGPIFLVPLSLSYPSSPVLEKKIFFEGAHSVQIWFVIESETKMKIMHSQCYLPDGGKRRDVQTTIPFNLCHLLTTTC